MAAGVMAAAGLVEAGDAQPGASIEDFVAGRTLSMVEISPSGTHLAMAFAAMARDRYFSRASVNRTATDSGKTTGRTSRSSRRADPAS